MNQVQVELSCHHWIRVHVEIAPNLPGHLCKFDGWQEVARWNPTEWRARCRSCRYGRWFGQDEQAAWLAKTRHEDAHVFHQVMLAKDTVTVDGRGVKLDIGTTLRPVYRHARGKRPAIPAGKPASHYAQEPPF